MLLKNALRDSLKSLSSNNKKIILPADFCKVIRGSQQNLDLPEIKIWLKPEKRVWHWCHQTDDYRVVQKVTKNLHPSVKGNEIEVTTSTFLGTQEEYESHDEDEESWEELHCD